MDGIPIHIGDGTGIDGGPYAACEVIGFNEGTVILRDQEGNRHYDDPDDIEDHLSEEMSRNEPISISGVHPDDGRATVWLPEVRGFLLDVRDDGAWVVGEDEWEDEREQAVRSATENGALLGPN